MSILILGAGAFGTALAVALGRERQVALWGRGLEGRQSARLPGVMLPENVTVMADLQMQDGALPLVYAGDTVFDAAQVDAIVMAASKAGGRNV